MAKAELVQELSTRLDMSRKDAEASLDAVIDMMFNKLGDGEEVVLPNFGKFTVEHKPQRQGRNPQTGESVIIAARKAVKFKPGSRLKEYINT